MLKKLQTLLNGQGENYILPFFWQHGEDEATLRDYMRAISEANIGAVCVESRPHPDFCGPKWWEDMDVILSEARKRNMKVWILDDSHFPTGFANGALAGKPDELCRQSVTCKTFPLEQGGQLQIPTDELLKANEFQPNMVEQMMMGHASQRSFDDDRLIGAYAVNEDGTSVNLQNCISEEGLSYTAAKAGKVYLLYLTRNLGSHRSYINMMSRPSCKVLLDAVYEPHWEHYKDDFGTTIAGFFSDEPELGNGHLYQQGNVLGNDTDFPWSDEVGEKLKERLSDSYVGKLYLLFENDAPDAEKAKVRYAYMDAVTELVREDFSYQVGDWCRAHGVAYIGHVIEDNNQHARCGSSLGHYFRGLEGQDMAGIDDIGGQVYPQGEDDNYDRGLFQVRNGNFYHFVLGKLANSAAAIEPAKHGDAMCEIFGNYGWEEGTQLEKYLIDHFMVRGVNHYVPHAFSPAPFPDPDCPPHFYAHGHNPLYRHFGELMKYSNRICNLITGGVHAADTAILYHGEAEWTGNAMLMEVPARILTEHQINFDFIPQDVFRRRDFFRTDISDGLLKVNTQKYRTVICPTAQFVTEAFALAVKELADAGVGVLFLERAPEGICDSENADAAMQALASGVVVKTKDLLGYLSGHQTEELSILPENPYIRYYHYEFSDGHTVFLVNEGTDPYTGDVTLRIPGAPYRYDAYQNLIEPVNYNDGVLKITIEPLKAVMLVFDDSTEKERELLYPVHLRETSKVRSFDGPFMRSLCESISYPAFSEEKEVSIPDTLSEELPKFSGYARYEASFTAKENEKFVLRITDAEQAMEVFLNGKSQGIQIVLPFVYELDADIKDGTNVLQIDVANTLDHMFDGNHDRFGRPLTAKTRSGITGEVQLLEAE